MLLHSSQYPFAVLTTATSPSYHCTFFQTWKRTGSSFLLSMLGEYELGGAHVCFPWLSFSSSGGFSLLKSRSETFSFFLHSFGFLRMSPTSTKQSHHRWPCCFRRIVQLSILTYVKKSRRLKSPMISITLSEVPVRSEQLKRLHPLSLLPDLNSMMNYSVLEIFCSSIFTTIYVYVRTSITFDLEITRFSSTSTRLLVTRLNCSFPAAGISFAGAETFPDVLIAVVPICPYCAPICLTLIHSWALLIFSNVFAGISTKPNIRRLQAPSPPLRLEACWASDDESASLASVAESSWWAYVARYVSWDYGNHFLFSKPNFMSLIGLPSSFKESLFQQSSFRECLLIQLSCVLCIILLELWCTSISSYYERSLTHKCQNNNWISPNMKIFRNSVFLSCNEEYLFFTLKIVRFNISTVGFHSPSGTNI
ncbi:predicted protein [Arabidopsis lyrata subsp. lyrata]|uniref:Predicted protein n=1 Tax=Arabidopsis lyrata subsp. lyrata TaxID=81972 RepID=D7LQX8_ARALL|nr:predicted protein [Arabidopsis lyrata subsp. lyrata]